jgi:hypothetical protein
MGSQSRVLDYQLKGQLQYRPLPILRSFAGVAAAYYKYNTITLKGFL